MATTATTDTTTTAPKTSTRRRGRPGEANRVLRVLLPIVALGIFIGIWEAYVAIKDISVLLLPAPHKIVQEFIDNFSQFWELSKNTFTQAMTGLLVATGLSIVVAGITFLGIYDDEYRLRDGAWKIHRRRRRSPRACL